MKIIIDNTDVTTKSGTNDKGRWEIRTQLGYMDTGKRYPAEVKIRLKDGEPAFAVGDYEIDLQKSVYVSKYGSAALSEELVLVPIVVTPKRAAAA